MGAGGSVEARVLPLDGGTVRVSLAEAFPTSTPGEADVEHLCRVTWAAETTDDDVTAARRRGPTTCQVEGPHGRAALDTRKLPRSGGALTHRCHPRRAGDDTECVSSLA